MRHMFDEKKAIAMWVMHHNGVTIHDIMRRKHLSKTAVYNWIKKVEEDPTMKSTATMVLKGQAREVKKNKSSIEAGSSTEVFLTKADQIRAWLKNNPEGTKSEFIRWSGMEVSQSQFSQIKTKMNGNNPPVKEAVTSHMKYASENAFLRWWNIGERKGWVDRLLEELKKD